MATLSAAITRVNENLGQLLPQRAIVEAARAVGHRWRQRKLGPAQAVVLLVLQLLRGNASLAEARALAGHAVSVAALAKARQRLPLELLRRVSAWLIEQFICTAVAADVSPPPRVLLVDAANYYTPDTPALRRRYRHPRQKRPHQRRGDYPQLRTLCVFDLHTGLMLRQEDFASDRGESPQLRRVLDRLGLRPGDVVIFDRAFVSYANLCLLVARGVHVVARLAKNLHARRGSRRICTGRLGKGDALVRWRKPPRGRGKRAATHPRALWRRLPAHLDLRQITVAAAAATRGSRCRRVTLITTLLDAEAHPAATLAAWYRRRWEIETDLRHLKGTLRLEFLRTKSVANVRRELLLRMIAYNLVRIVMLEAARQRKTAAQRVSFADACRWLLLSQLCGVSLLTLLINPVRRRRPRPRKLKYRGKNYRLLTTRVAPQRRVA
jgi:Transposase DDE domain